MDETSIDEFEQYTPYEQTTWIQIGRMPISLQSSKGARADFSKHVRKRIRDQANILTGDVHVEIVWRMNYQKRYETADRPDVDNIVKPILDALSGPTGLLVDDCQVMSVFSAWHDWEKEDEEEVLVKLQYLTGESIRRDSILFVEFERLLCMPIDRTWTPVQQAHFLSAYEGTLATRIRLENAGFDVARYMRSSQRYFHKSRVQTFPIEMLGAAKKRLSASWPTGVSLLP